MHLKPHKLAKFGGLAAETFRSPRLPQCPVAIAVAALRESEKVLGLGLKYFVLFGVEWEDLRAPASSVPVKGFPSADRGCFQCRPV